MRNKQVGLLVIGIAILFFFIVMSFNNALDTIVSTSCTHGVSCPMQVTLTTQKQISYGLIGLLVVVGGLIAFFMKDEVVHHHTTIHQEKKVLSEEERKKRLNGLDEGERQIMDLVLQRDGSVYQSELIKELKLSKVKVSRLLDKLEGKGLVERKRRGMTNVVISKVAQ